MALWACYNVAHIYSLYHHFNRAWLLNVKILLLRCIYWTIIFMVFIMLVVYILYLTLSTPHGGVDKALTPLTPYLIGAGRASRGVARTPRQRGTLGHRKRRTSSTKVRKSYAYSAHVILGQHGEVTR